MVRNDDYERQEMNSSLASQLESRPHGQAAKLAAVLKLTQTMLTAAQSGEWVEVSEGELHRRVLLEECFSKPVNPELSEIFAEALATMLHMNEELVALLEAAKADLAAAMKGQSVATKKLHQYLSVESSGS